MRKGKKLEHHGMSKSRPYRIWRKMLERCLNENHVHYKDYGGRGITIHRDWLISFEAFWHDMQPSYRADKSLDRIDSDKGYSKANCRWATDREQMHNRRDNIYLSLRGRTLPIREWVKETGINRKTLVSRMRMGWPQEMALSKAVQIKSK